MKLTKAQHDYLSLLPGSPRLCLMSYRPATALIKEGLASWQLPKQPGLTRGYGHVLITEAGLRALKSKEPSDG